MGIKAIVMPGPGRLELRGFPKPELREGMMLVRMLMAGICGTDRRIFEGRMPLDFPIIPGHENIGVIEEIADEARTCMVGR